VSKHEESIDGGVIDILARGFLRLLAQPVSNSRTCGGLGGLPESEDSSPGVLLPLDYQPERIADSVSSAGQISRSAERS